MAKIITYSNHMKINSSPLFNNLVGISMIFIGFLSSVFIVWAGILFLVLGIIILFTTNSEKGRIFTVGMKGEEEVSRNLEKLDDNYTVVNNYRLSERGDIDHVIIGPKGIFVVETKNLNGRVSFENGSFEYIKTGRRGGIYPGKSEDPVRQANFHAGMLRKKLIDGVKLKNARLFIPHIPGIVVFTKNTEIEKDKNLEIPILRPCELPEYILSQKNAMDKKNQKIIEDILLN